MKVEDRLKNSSYEDLANVHLIEPSTTEGLTFETC